MTSVETCEIMHSALPPVSVLIENLISERAASCLVMGTNQGYWMEALCTSCDRNHLCRHGPSASSSVLSPT